MPRRRSNFAFLPAFFPLAAASSAAAVLELASVAEDLYPTIRFSTGAVAATAAAGAAAGFSTATATEAVAVPASRVTDMATTDMSLRLVACT